MKRRILICLLALYPILSFGQVRYEWGDKFEFNAQDETNARIVLTDNYNTYLMSVVNVDGMLSSHKFIVRKFDQKNQLLDTYTQDFQKIDGSTLYNYLGTVEPNDHQVAIFAESYSGKEKKKDIYKYVFEKSTAKFTTSLVISYPIESAMRSGTTKFSVSQNKRYAGFINMRNPKKDPTIDNVVMLETSTLSVLWNKDVPMEDKIYDRAFTVTNSGKAVLLRADKGLKLNNSLVVVSQDKQEDKTFEDNIMLHDPVAISIGSEDYLVDFAFASKGLRSGDYEKLIFYSLNAGKTLKNSKITEFNSLNDINDIRFREILIQSDAIRLFTEAKVKAGTRPTKVNPFSSMTFDQPYYKYGPGNLITLSLDGEVKEIRKISIDYNAEADFYHSYGLLNINGNYYVNSGNAGGLYEFKLESDGKPAPITNLSNQDDPYRNESPKVVTQLTGYIKDARKAIVCRTHYDNKMSLVSVIGFPK